MTAAPLADRRIREESRTDRLPVALLLLPACFIIEVILGGPFGVYGGVSVRFILFWASCAVLLLALLIRGRVVRSHLLPILSIAGFMVLNGIWVAIVPVLTGTDYHWAVREPHAFVVLGLVILTLAVFPPEQLGRVLRGLQRLVVLASLVLATFQVGLWVLGTLLPELRWVVPLAIGAAFRGSRDQLYIGLMPDGFFRVFWISTLWCLLAFFWVPLVLPTSRLRWLLQGLLLLDLFVAYSRGIWLGLLAGLLVASASTLTLHNLGRTLVRFAVVGGLVAGALAGFLAATDSLELGGARLASTASREDESIGQRVEQAPYLLELWYEHPVLGNGYGAYAPGHLRSQEAPYSYEHMPYALLAKLGIVGMLVSGAFFLGWGLTAWEARRRAPAQVASFLGSCTALLVAEMTNPMVLNFVSMTIFACLLIQWAHLVVPANHGGRLDGACPADRQPGILLK